MITDYEKELGYTFQALIVVKSNGLNYAVYVDFGGFPDRMMKILNECYNSQELAEQIISYGFIPILRCPELMEQDELWFVDEDDLELKKSHGFNMDKDYDFFYRWNGISWSYQKVC